jgi:histidyl-tRNA synthetase
MSEPLSTDPYKGVRDFYPADWARMETVFARLRETLALRGYEEYNASPLERAELYEAKTSEEIVSEQTYTFTDRGDRRVTLRPEMTPTLARMVAAKRRELAFPLRWFSIPNVFRYERPQRGRLREHYQLNVDLLGVKDAKADGEIIAVAHALLAAFGAKNEDFVIRVNSRALLDAAASAAGLSAEAKRSYLRLLDKRSKMTKEEYAAALETITATDPLALIEKDDAHILGEKQKLLALISAFAARGMTNVVFDPSNVRGFDYYTGIVFETYDTDISNPRALFGGGRYDNLVAQFGGEPVPAVGFGMGDVTLLDFLATHNLLPASARSAEVYLGTPSEEDLAGANAVAEELRARGIRVFVNITDKSLGDQVKDADRRGIPYFAAVGADERASGTLRVKHLSSGEETPRTAAELADHLRAAAR